MALLLDLTVSQFSTEHPLVAAEADCFPLTVSRASRVVDPRMPITRTGAVRADLQDGACSDRLLKWWTGQFATLLENGVAGFRCMDPAAATSHFWRRLISGVRRQREEVLFIAATYGMTRQAVKGLGDCGFDFLLSSLPWWDGRAHWLVEEYESLRTVAPLIAAPEAPFSSRLAARFPTPRAARSAYRSAIALTAATGCGALIPMGFEDGLQEPLHPIVSDMQQYEMARETRLADFSADIRVMNDLVRTENTLRTTGFMRSLTAPSHGMTALIRFDAPDERLASEALLALINPDCEHPCPLDTDLRIGVDLQAFRPLQAPEATKSGALAPGEVRLLKAGRERPIVLARRLTKRIAKQTVEAPRLVISDIAPNAGGGYACKGIVGDETEVTANIFGDGHEALGAELRWRELDRKAWQRTSMAHVGNNRWQAIFPLSRIGRYEFSIEAWIDRYGGFVRDLRKKAEAGVVVAADIAEGRALFESVAARAEKGLKNEFQTLALRLSTLAADEQVALFLDPTVQEAMKRVDERPFQTEMPPTMLECERRAARYASWYELFPRSQTQDTTRPGTLRDVIPRLPALRDMGFDVLYLTPIHPIGRKNRKGRNNSLIAEGMDPGSPYAIGDATGGHDAIHPDLGTIEDFRALRDEALRYGLEIALDFAIQCSPDHPWLKEHPEWFAWRPDGSLKFAENPPKKYEDIVNVDFYTAGAVPDLWLALRDVVMHWVGEGVKTFRVDNPHTKPLPFWEWFIKEIRSLHPDVIFLSEAFTQPKMMYQLARIGFSQSYTYFTWRHSKRELTDYLTELTTTEAKDFFRPHFFVNTPDINPYFLQTSGRPGFLIRAALAATLSGLWGIYSGFELLESDPVPGKEEYRDSEKYEIKVRDWSQPGAIVAEISQLNRIRAAHPALQTHLGLTFYNAFNDNILYYGKAIEARDEIVLVAINLDPHSVQEADIEIPLWEWRIPDDGAVDAEDLLSGHSFVWHGKRQHIRLDPHSMPYAIWSIRRPEGART